MTMLFTTSDALVQDQGVKIGVHGRAGAGKTRLLGTLPDPLVLSAEAGMLSLRDLKLPTMVIRTMSDLYAAYGWVTGTRSATLPNGWVVHPDMFKSVGIDSATEIAENVLAAEKKARKDPRQAYGEMADQVMALLKAFRDLPRKHVYFTFKQDWVKDDVTGISRFGPMMPGQQVGKQVPYLFDELFSLEVGQQQTPQGTTEFRYLRTALGVQHEAKDRSGALDPFEQPNLTHIITKILRIPA